MSLGVGTWKALGSGGRENKLERKSPDPEQFGFAQGTPPTTRSKIPSHPIMTHEIQPPDLRPIDNDEIVLNR